MDYKDFTDEQLDEARTAILVKQELSAEYTEGGRDREGLLKAVGEHEQ